MLKFIIILIFFRYVISTVGESSQTRSSFNISTMSSKENELAYEKSEEIFKDWEKLFMSLIQHKAVNALDDGNGKN